MNVYSLLSKQPKQAAGACTLPKGLNDIERIQTGEKVAVCSSEPDLVVTVGGTKFLEYRQTLRSWSGYFDAAFRCVMDESQSKRFEFPDRRPVEWAWIAALMTPLTKAKITMATLPIAVDWFSMLSSPRGLEECDRVLSQDFLSKLVGKDNCIVHLRSVLEYLDMSIECDLRRSKKRCFDIIRHALIRCPTWFAANKEVLCRITSLVKDHQECHQELWNVLKLYIPSSITEEKQETLLQNDLLHEFIFLELSLRQVLTQSLNEAHLADTDWGIDTDKTIVS